MFFRKVGEQYLSFFWVPLDIDTEIRVNSDKKLILQFQDVEKILQVRHSFLGRR